MNDKSRKIVTSMEKKTYPIIWAAFHEDSYAEGRYIYKAFEISLCSATWFVSAFLFRLEVTSEKTF